MERYTDYKDSGVQWLGKIPSHWEIRRTKYLWQETDSRSEYGSEQLLSVSQYDGVREAQSDSRSESLKGYKIVKQENLVINIMLAWLGGLGVSKHEGIVSPAYCVYKLFDAQNPYYLHYLYRTPLYLAEFARHSTGIVPSRWRMYTDDFGEVLTILPPIKEQNRMVEYLDEATSKLDEAIAQQQKMIDLLNERKQIIINNAVTKGLNPNVSMKYSGNDWIGDIPEHWEVKRFKRCANIKANLVHPKDYSHYPQISPDNIEKNTGRLLSYNTVIEAGVISDNHLFKKGQIIYSKIRPALNKAIIAPFEGLCSADMYPIETKNDTHFMLYAILSHYFSDQVQLVVNDRVKMPKINKEELGEIMIVYPKDKNEQIEIAEYLDNVLDNIVNVESEYNKQISLLQERKQIIINEVVTGKVKVS